MTTHYALKFSRDILDYINKKDIWRYLKHNHDAYAIMNQWHDVEGIPSMFDDGEHVWLHMHYTDDDFDYAEHPHNRESCERLVNGVVDYCEILLPDPHGAIGIDDFQKCTVEEMMDAYSNLIPVG